MIDVLVLPEPYTPVYTLFNTKLPIFISFLFAFYCISFKFVFFSIGDGAFKSSSELSSSALLSLYYITNFYFGFAKVKIPSSDSSNLSIDDLGVFYGLLAP